VKGIIFWLFALLLLIAGLWYWSDKQGGKINFSLPSVNQKPTALLSSPTPILPATTISRQSLETLLQDYLPKNLLDAAYGGKVFCDQYLYGYDDQHAYLWTYCEEYYLKKGQLKRGVGISLPTQIELAGQKGVLAITGHSLELTFPEPYASQAAAGFPANKFSNLPEDQAKTHHFPN